MSLLTAYPGSPVLDIAEEKGYLIENFSWDDLVINTSQLTTEEWTPEELIKLVKREQIKTKLSVYLSEKNGRIHLLKVIIDKLLSFIKIKSNLLPQLHPKPNNVV